ncbi:MAG: HAD family hydrolase [Gaiellales bacterium]
MTSAILFDLDDTLVPDGAAFRQAALATAHGLDLPDELVEAVRLHSRAAWRDGPHWGWFEMIGCSSWEGLWAPAGGSGARIEAIREWLSAVYRPGAWRAGLEQVGADPLLAERAAREFQEHRTGCCSPYPDAVPVLERVRAAGLRVAVVTNGMSDLQWLKLKQAGLTRYADAFVASSAAGIGKPHARIFELALERLGCTADGTSMVGDSLRRDIAGAQAAGLRAVWIDRAGGEPGDISPDARIESLADLTW